MLIAPKKLLAPQKKQIAAWPRAATHSAVAALRPAADKQLAPAMAVPRGLTSCASQSSCGWRRPRCHSRAPNHMMAIARGLPSDPGANGILASRTARGHRPSTSTCSNRWYRSSCATRGSAWTT